MNSEYPERIRCIEKGPSIICDWRKPSSACNLYCAIKSSVGKYILQYTVILLEDDAGPYWTVFMHKLIWAFSAHKMVLFMQCASCVCIFYNIIKLCHAGGAPEHHSR